MAVSEATTSEQDKTNIKPVHKSRDKRERPLTKVIIRRLPPGMDQESFLMQVSPIPEHDYIYTIKGDMSLGEYAFTRVYINFLHPEDIFVFKEKFDNYVFVDQKGHEYPAVVEFASFQKCPKKRKPRSDLKCGSIESDPYYLEFLESLKEQRHQDEKPEYSYQFSNENKEDTSTPLLEFVKQRRIDRQRIREERREERKRKEIDRKNKYKEDERKRHAHIKTVVVKANNSRSKVTLDNVKEEINEKPSEKTNLNAEENKDVPVSNKDKLCDDVKSSPKTLEEGNSVHSSGKGKSYEDRKPPSKIKPRFPLHLEKREFVDKKSDYRSKRDDYKEYKNKRLEENKRETDVKQFPKKVAKKYSEKREERKNEARRFEQKKLEPKSELLSDAEKKGAISTESTEPYKPVAEKNSNIELDVEQCQETKLDENEKQTDLEKNTVACTETRDYDDDRELKGVNKENDPRVQRRIRNKDRPTMAIYQPGMLSKKKSSDGGDTSKAANENE